MIPGRVEPAAPDGRSRRRRSAASAPSTAAGRTRGWRSTWSRTSREDVRALARAAQRRAARPASGESARGQALSSRAVRRLPRGARHRRPRARSGPTSRTSASRASLGAGTLPNNARRRSPAWIASSQHIKPGNRMPSYRRASPADELRALAATSRACDVTMRVSDTRCPNPLPRPPGRARRAAPRLAAAVGLARAHRRQQHLHRRLLRRHRVALLRAGRRARAADAHAARRAREHAGRPEPLQPALHDARHGDDVPVRRAGGRGDGRAAAAEHARRARPAVPAPVRLRVLGLLRRRAAFLLQHLLRRSRRRRLVHVPAAHDARRTRRASTPTSGCSASASSRSRRSPARSRSSSASCARARRA